MEKPEIVYYPAAEKPLTPPELAATIGAALDGNPKLEQAFRQYLGQRLAFATVECADVNLAERQAGHAGGRVSEVLQFQQDLASYAKQAREMSVREKGSTRSPLAEAVARRRGTRHG